MVSSSQKSFLVDEFRPEDAEGIVSLFRAVYGEGYPIRLFYDPEAIIAANRDGSYLSIVVRSPSGKVVGVNHLVRTAPFEGVYEHAAGLVMKEYRGTGAMKETQAYLYNEFTPRNPHIEELFGEPVCNHTILQKGVLRFGFIETGIEIALMPAEAYTTEKSATGRVATLDVFRCYVPMPHRIFLPQTYETILRQIYARLGDVRYISVSNENLPENVPTQTKISIFDYARVARIAVAQAGGNFSDILSRLENEARAKNAVVFQVWLNLTEPWVGKAVEILRQRGYFFGGAFPRWFDGDGLLLQKLECPPDFENIVIYSEEAKQLLNIIQKDWEKTI
ncbi:MAG: hypothetical protein A4E71_00851 [Smithella sp. PtaU1.Bin162]|nr:MAG: hypothetical protein A4E71_00851 [Smithella sp. PtaU1.Bin162]